MPLVSREARTRAPVLCSMLDCVYSVGTARIPDLALHLKQIGIEQLHSQGLKRIHQLLSLNIMAKEVVG